MTTTAFYPDLKDRHALVTGGAQGIGLATVEAMIEQGMRVSVLDIDEEGGERHQDCPGAMRRGARADQRPRQQCSQ